MYRGSRTERSAIFLGIDQVREIFLLLEKKSRRICVKNQRDLGQQCAPIKKRSRAH